jgi:hypothetical protein
MSTWAPGQPWPGTAGGATSPHWSPYVRLYVLAAIGSGLGFHMGQHGQDRLDAGNVMGHVAGTGTLWVDITCDVLDVQISGGVDNAEGIFSKPDAATCEVTIADPGHEYDPLTPAGRFTVGGRSRLVPGTPVHVFAEVVDPTTAAITTHDLFTGTADSWQQDWTPTPSKRQTILIATDVTKQFARMDRAEQPAIGGGDTVQQRIHRIVDYFGWTGVVLDPAGGGTRTLQATTLAQSAWELLQRTLDDELGFVYFTTKGELRWLKREAWQTIGTPYITLGCDVGYDVLVDTTSTALDRQMRNAVYAARTGGTSQQSISQASIDKFGRYEYNRTDLGLNDDTQVSTWTSFVVQLYAYPQTTLADVTMQPRLAAQPWACWRDVLSTKAVTDVARVVWYPPDHPTHIIDQTSRVVGFKHAITRGLWEVTWQLIAANVSQSAGAVFHMGPHAQDRLDSNFVLGFAA